MTITLNRIPVVDAPFQQIEIVFNEVACTLTFRYNKIINRWSFDLGINTAPTVINGRRIVLGSDLIAIYNLGIGRIFALDYFQMGVDPGYEELVDGRVRLYHLTEEEVATIVADFDEPTSNRVYVPSESEKIALRTPVRGHIQVSLAAIIAGGEISL